MLIRIDMMRVFTVFLCLVLLLNLLGCAGDAPAETLDKTALETSSEKEPTEIVQITAPSETMPAMNVGNIWLYGEAHGEEQILEMELNRWQKHYHEDGMRHLFVEIAYFSAAYLNLWMQSDNDTILYQLFDDWEGTSAGATANMDFYKAVKQACPETVFHGTDIGHQFWNTGSRYLDDLEAWGLMSSDEYVLAQEAITQGRIYYSSSDVDADIYRENTMTANFIREFEKLNGESVMGIYGSAHINLDGLNYSGQCDSMGKQLKTRYGELVSSEDLAELVRITVAPERVDTLEINGKSYTAEYYGKTDLSTAFPSYSHREFWRLVDAGEDFAQWTTTGNVLPQSNYPMLIEEGQIYVIRYTLADGSTHTEYHRCDGITFNGQQATVEITDG